MSRVRESTLHLSLFAVFGQSDSPNTTTRSTQPDNDIDTPPPLPSLCQLFHHCLSASMPVYLFGFLSACLLAWIFRSLCLGLSSSLLLQSYFCNSFLHPHDNHLSPHFFLSLFLRVEIIRAEHCLLLSFLFHKYFQHVKIYHKCRWRAFTHLVKDWLIALEN